jgi:hypothetical protein
MNGKGEAMRYMDFAQPPQGRGWPERLVLVGDGSASMATTDWSPSRLYAVVEAASALISVKQANHPDDEVGVVTFNTDARVLHPVVRVGSGAEELKQALRRADAAGNTNIRAGLKEAQHLLFSARLGTSGAGFLGWFDRLGKSLYGVQPAAPKAAPKPEKLLRIVLLTDGEHNTVLSPVGLAQKLKEAGVVIDCIGIGGSPANVDEKLLKNIASKNKDGSVRYCFIGDKEQLIQKYRQLANRLRWT